jgi:hypothetical protein
MAVIQDQPDDQTQSQQTPTSQTTDQISTQPQAPTIDRDEVRRQLWSDLNEQQPSPRRQEEQHQSQQPEHQQPFNQPHFPPPDVDGFIGGRHDENDDDEDYVDLTGSNDDGYPTQTSEIQREVEESILPLYEPYKYNTDPLPTSL